MRLGNEFDDSIGFEKLKEDLYYILTEKTKGDAAARVRSVEKHQSRFRNASCQGERSIDGS